MTYLAEIGRKNTALFILLYFYWKIPYYTVYYQPYVTCPPRRIVRQTTTNRAFKCMAQQDLITTFVEATIHWRVINKSSLFHFQREIYHFVRLFFPFSLHFLYILDHTFKCHLFLSFDAPYRSTALMKVSLCGIW